MSEDDNTGDDITLSPGDIEKVKAAKAAVSQAQASLNDIPEDVREEYGDLDDAIESLEHAERSLEEVVPTEDAGQTEGTAAASD